MFKSLLILLLSAFLLFSCSKKNNEEVLTDVTEEDLAVRTYAEAVKALREGDAFYAAKKFKETENLLPQSKWAAKASLMASYAEYSRNSYADSVYGLNRFIKNYPSDENIPYDHYLIAICYYEQILDEKKRFRSFITRSRKI